MSQLTKQQLIVENNSSFPNNNSGLITPEELRGFNVDMIDSNVNQTVYTTDSASFDSRINAGSVPAGTISSSAQIIAALPTNVVSGSTQITNLGFVQSSITASSLVTASFDNNTRNLTFTKGEGSQFSLNIPDVSGSTIDTGSFATTGSNVFNGNQTIQNGGTRTGIQFNSGSGKFFVGLNSDEDLVISGSLSGLNSNLISFKKSNGNIEVDIPINFNNPSLFRNNATFRNIRVDGYGFGYDAKFDTISGSNANFNSLKVINPTGSTTINNTTVSGSINITGSLTASIAEGHLLVGGAGNISQTVPTSSLSGASTGSLMVTGSVAVNVLTFTKGDGSTFDLTVSASGSVVPGTISGSQQITDLGFVSSSITGSSLITASFDNGTRNLTFTKGDNTTFNVNIPDVSGSTIDTGSFATTGSNTFNGNQTISGSVFITEGNLTLVNNPLVVTGSIFTSGGNNNVFGTGQTFFSGSVIISSSATFDLMVTGGIECSTNYRVASASGTGSLSAVTVVISDSGSSSSNTKLLQSTIGRGYASFISGSIGNIQPYNVVSVFAGRSTIGGFTQAAAPAGGGIAVNSGSAGGLGSGFYYPIQFQASNAYTDGRVTLATPLVSNAKFISSGSNEFTGSLFVGPSYQVRFATGSNQQAGTAVLDGGNPGTVTVSNSLVNENSIILVSKQTLVHTNGYVAVSAKSAGSFTITSNHNGDTDTVGWFVINNS